MLVYDKSVLRSDVDYFYEVNLSREQKIAHLCTFAEPRVDQDHACIYKEKIIEFMLDLFNKRILSYSDALLIVKFINAHVNYRFLSKSCINSIQLFVDTYINNDRARLRLRTFLYHLCRDYVEQPEATEFYKYREAICKQDQSENCNAIV